MSDDTDMAELIAFLTACVDGDEHYAHQAKGLAGIENAWWTWTALKQRFPTFSRGDAQHIERHGPYRVLRAVEGKRRTLAEYAGNPLSFEEWPLFPLFNMAREYADRPGFQTWWAPDLS